MIPNEETNNITTEENYPPLAYLSLFENQVSRSAGQPYLYPILEKRGTDDWFTVESGHQDDRDTNRCGRGQKCEDKSTK